MKTIERKPKLKKYVCMYYGWISDYGDWDMDSFHIMAYNKDEAIVKSKERLKLVLLKGDISVILETTYLNKKKYIQKPAEKPGLMRLEELKEQEEQERKGSKFNNN